MVRDRDEESRMARRLPGAGWKGANQIVMDEQRFYDGFEALTGFAPLRWQTRLYRRMVEGDWPGVLDIPTGLGKTSAVACWLLALADAGARGLSGGAVPRRLVYVVNRRTIVDQATGVAERFRDKLDRSHEDYDARLDAVRGALASLAGVETAALSAESEDGAPLAISTLRGGFADNEAWLKHPARPAIVVGTVDMIGSRLLFGGYRAYPSQRAMLAGLMGVDTLVLHDEAHLTPNFQRLLGWVRRCQGKQKTPRAMRVMQMSATAVPPSGAAAEELDDETPPEPLRLEDEDYAQPLVRQRVHAAKRLHVHPLAKKPDLVKRMAELATRHEEAAARVIVFVRSPGVAAKLVERLVDKKGHGIDAERVALLTGTIRGYERDRLVDTPVLRALLGEGDPVPGARTVYLVSTSAGEVGADFDADHLVCDATTLDSLVQRLGRVNRRGSAEGEPPRRAEVDLLDDSGTLKKSAFDEAVKATAALFRGLPGAGVDVEGVDVSPAALREIVESVDGGKSGGRVEVRSPVLPWVEPHEVTLDAWSLTSVTGRWPLAHDRGPYLHGIEEGAAPETVVAWRDELDAMQGKGTPRFGAERAAALGPALTELFRVHRLRTHETLRTTGVDAVAGLLAAMGGHDGWAEGVVPWFATLRRGEATVHLLERDADEAALRDVVSGATVVLPASQGGLSDGGMLSKAAVGRRAFDVADVHDGRYAGLPGRARFVVEREPDERWRVGAVGGATPARDDGADGQDEPDHETEARARSAALGRVSLEKPARVVTQLELSRSIDGDVTRRLLLIGPQRAVAKPEAGLPLSDHVRDVTANAARTGTALLTPRLASVVELAARLHDSGKARAVWQRAVHNPDAERTDEPWGKSGRRSPDWSGLHGFRHEFATMLDGLHDPEVQALPDDDRDLLLHLIGCHHGRARPHFSVKAHTHPANGGQADELSPGAVARRFDRLQRRYGHWGLAWHEALLMAADIAASADENDRDDPEPEAKGARP